MQLPTRKDTITAGRNFLYLGLPSYVGFVMEFFASIYIARTLGVTDYGVLGTVYAFIALFRFLPDMGMSQLLIRDIAQDENSASTQLFNATLLRLGLSVLTVGMLNAAAWGVYEETIRYLILIYSIMLVGESIYQPPLTVCIALRRFRLTGMMNLIHKIITACLPPLALLLGYGFSGVLWAAVIASLLNCYTVVALIRFTSVRYRFSIDLGLMKGYFRQGYPIALSACFYLLSTRIDRIMLSKMLSMTAVGHYTIASKLLFIALEGVWGPIANIVFPILSKTFAERKERFVGKTLLYAVVLVGIFLVISALAVLLGKHFIVFVWGEQYTASYSCLAILIWSSVFTGLTQLLYRTLIIFGAQALYLIVQIGGAMANVAFNYLLISSIGMNGAAWATVLTSAVTMALSVMICGREIKKIRRTG
ncbi:MAG: flippase [Proteobacteria bacterium]|nr:flippase [Pseudomonadota bacterium]